ncbi:hypothetical protein Tco_1234558 [Tanacetum coccineum]
MLCAPRPEQMYQIFSLSNRGCLSARATAQYSMFNKPQRKPIFPIVVALLKNTNFFRAFTASSTGLYSCQLDEQWFNLHKDILRDALDITPANDNYPFVAPPIRMKDDRTHHPAHSKCQVHQTDHPSSENQAQHSPKDWFASSLLTRGKHSEHSQEHPTTATTKSMVPSYKQFFDAERGKADEGRATESSDATKVTKPKATKVTKPSGDKALKPTATQPPKPKPAPTSIHLKRASGGNMKTSFTDQFFMEKPHEEESGKMNAKTEVQSMVSVPIHQDTSSVPPMTTSVIDLTMMQSDSPLPTSIATISTIPTTITTLPPPPLQPQQSTAYLILVKCIGELKQHMMDLIQNNLALEERLDKQGSQLYNLENLNIPHNVSQAVDEIVTDAKSLKLDYSNQHLADQEEARKKKRKKHAALRTPFGSPPSPPPPPPPLAGSSGAPASEAPSSSKPVASTHQSMAWTTSDTRFDSTDYTVAQDLSPTDSLVQDDSIPDEQRTTGLLRWFQLLKPLLRHSFACNDWRHGDCHEIWRIHSVTDAHNSGSRLTWTISRRKRSCNIACHDHGSSSVVLLVMSSNPSQFFFNKDLEYLRYGSKRSNPALSISMMKAASYHDFGLELLVPKQMWIDDVCTYDISAKYGISH